MQQVWWPNWSDSQDEVGVPIYVEDASSGDDRLFHEWKLNKEAMTAMICSEWQGTGTDGWCGGMGDWCLGEGTWIHIFMMNFCEEFGWE